MPRVSLETVVTFPPRIPPRPLLREVLRLAFEEFQWFKPAEYGFGTRSPPPEGPIEYDFILDTLLRRSAVTIIAKTDAYFLFLSVRRREGPEYIGKLTWVVPATKARRASWCEEHQRQVVQLMQLLDSPLAYSALFKDIHTKEWRTVEDKVGSHEESTVRDYSEGLAGIYWRNFYGEPFVKLFGERLAALPPESVTRLEGGRVLVQPYKLPTEAGSAQSREQERRFTHLLGPECFYNFEHHQKPSRRPEVTPPEAL